jgi:hypothetical protein
MTTDLDGKPVLLLKEDDVRALLTSEPPMPLLERLQKFLTDCASHKQGPTFDQLCRAHPAVPYQQQDTELPRPDENKATMDGRVM